MMTLHTNGLEMSILTYLFMLLWLVPTLYLRRLGFSARWWAGISLLSALIYVVFNMARVPLYYIYGPGYVTDPGFDPKGVYDWVLSEPTIWQWIWIGSWLALIWDVLFRRNTKPSAADNDSSRGESLDWNQPTQ